MKHYTIGEIFRLGLLKNHKGEAYKHKSTVRNMLGKAKKKKVQGQYGPTYQVSEQEIDRLNHTHTKSHA